MPIAALAPAVPAGAAVAGEWLGIAGLGGIAGYLTFGNGGTLDQLKAQMAAQQKAKAIAKPVAKVQARACAQCKRKTQFPCQELACGVKVGGVNINTSPYKGGADWCMGLKKNDGKDSHHTPADEASYLPRKVGPAIQMAQDYENGITDHTHTSSNGSSYGAIGYRAVQQNLINNGHWQAATDMDIVDIRSRYGSKYDMAIADMQAYTSCLKKEGVIV